MSELSIKVKIAGRQFPLTIQREEEEAVRLAAKRVDEQFRFFQ
ncbi:MAG: cell division protein ZapA (FtsZ GTPase activity inhibitor), partial [Flavobacteriales bacterium]